MFQLRGPESHDLQFFREWFQRSTMGSFPLNGRDRDYWKEENEKDLVALCPHKVADSFTQWIIQKATPLFHHVLGFKLKVSCTITVNNSC